MLILDNMLMSDGLSDLVLTNRTVQVNRTFIGVESTPSSKFVHVAFRQCVSGCVLVRDHDSDLVYGAKRHVKAMSMLEIDVEDETIVDNIFNRHASVVNERRLLVKR